MVRAHRLLMVCSRLLAEANRFSPSTHLRPSQLTLVSRRPPAVPFSPHHAPWHSQNRFESVPGAAPRPKLTLRLQVQAGSAMQPPGKRMRPEDGQAPPAAGIPQQQQQPTKGAQPSNGAPSQGRQPQQQQQQQGGRKRKPLTPEIEARLAIQAAAREGDVDKALRTYDTAAAAGTKLSLDSYASILYLCSGGDDWESALQHAPADPGAVPEAQAPAEGSAAPASPSGPGDEASGGDLNSAQAGGEPSDQAPPRRAVQVTPALLQRGRELREHMQAAGLKPTEICFTALARMAALGGDPDLALSTARDALARGLPIRLRTFTPALAAFAEAGRAGKAFEVDRAIEAAGLELGEAEYSRLLQAAAAGGATWEEVAGVLRRMSKELTVLQQGTMVRLRQLFVSPSVGSGFRPGSGPKRWRVEECSVDEEGRCSASCGGTLAALDLDELEYHAFKGGVAALAQRQERQPHDFAAFMEWLEANGPFGAVVDAANVAFYGQNFASGGFTFAQIGAVVDRLREDYPGVRPLVVLHVNRTRAAPAQRAQASALLDRLQADKCFYATPHGSNDDWYWMYAAVAGGPSGLLVSNDEMRDHIFAMLAPRYFQKWKQRHQLRYTFVAEGRPEFCCPPPYTTCTQQLDNGAWVFPAASGAWLAAIPDGAAAAGGDAC